jgi:thiamine-phosphate pyrophosphorylase
LVEAAVAADVSLIQIREKALNARVLFELTLKSVEITKGTQTQLLVNDRFDIALAAAADGVQLTSRSVGPEVVRATCGSEFVIGVSTHSLEEALSTRDNDADFVVFGPVFDTESKREFGAPQGIEKLREVTQELTTFPVVAIGGVSVDNAGRCLDAGAAGVAAISMMNDATQLQSVIDSIKKANT